MKKLLVGLSLMFVCNVVFADTINLHWLNEDGTTYQNSTCTVDGDLVLPSTPPTKYGYTFTGWKMTGYTPIEYLESTGTQWIDTEIQAGTESFAVEADYYISSIPSSCCHAIIGNETTKNYPWIGYTANNFVVTMGGNGFPRLFSNVSSQAGRHSFSFTNNYSSANLVFDNVNKGTVNSYPYENLGLNLYLFASNKNNTAIHQISLRIYSMKIWNNGVLVRDFIPVLDKDGTPCMFDKVEGKFYYNQGTGDFIAGPVLTE